MKATLNKPSLEVRVLVLLFPAFLYPDLFQSARAEGKLGFVVW